MILREFDKKKSKKKENVCDGLLYKGHSIIIKKGKVYGEEGIVSVC